MEELGSLVKELRGSDKQEAYAAEAGISRTKLSIIENAARGYQVDVLVKALSVRTNPVKKLIAARDGVDRLTSMQIQACWTVIAALKSDQHRQSAIDFLNMLDRALGTDSRTDELRKEFERSERQDGPRAREKV